MKRSSDLKLELMTLPELRRERLQLFSKIRLDTANVRDARRFGLLNGLIATFEQAKRAATITLPVPHKYFSSIVKATITPFAADCDICKCAKATVFLTDILNGKLHRVNYCEPCSSRLNNSIANLLEGVEKTG